MSSVRIAHVTDVHMSAQLIENAGKVPRAPHRYGHSFTRLCALDRALKATEWDAIVFTGDLTRVGSPDGLSNAHDWIYRKRSTPTGDIGLELERQAKPVIVIPGNHDCFEGNLTQSTTANFHQQFGAVPPLEPEVFKLNGIDVEFTKIDSTWTRGSFARGNIDNHLLDAHNPAGTLNVAVLHHHVVQPPSKRREAATELKKTTSVARRLLTGTYDAVLFGHTHWAYVDFLPVGLVGSVLHQRRAKGRWRRRIFPRSWLGELGADFCRIKSKDGKFLTNEEALRYLYLKRVLKKPLPDPAKSSQSELRAALDGLMSKAALREKMYEDSARVLVSNAPSGCQAEARRAGFHILEFTRGQSGWSAKAEVYGEVTGPEYGLVSTKKWVR